MKVIKKLKTFMCRMNPFYLHTPHLDKFIYSIDDIREDVQKVRDSLEQEKAYLEKRLKDKEAILTTIMNTIPDMAWYKDIEGNYVYANKAIKRHLLCEEDPVGLNDVTIANNAKRRYGEGNHTFGEKCSNSDFVTIQEGKPCRFVENGKVKGKHLELEVYKNVVRDEYGDIIGTVGTGRDITEYVEAVNMMSSCNSKCPVIDVFNKNRFGDADG